MLNFNQVALRRGPRLLFEGVTFTVHAGQKIGITGANGVGKSSLFALIRGELHCDQGEVTLPPNLVIAHVAQETPATDIAAIDYVMDGDKELRVVEKALAQAQQDDNGDRIAQLHDRFEAIDGYSARMRAARLMSGLGFSPDQEQTSVNTFSGGWRMRLNLAQALMCRSDLLLLDEPTNHLDLEAVIWLEEWLRSYPGTLLLISHDRDFLDRVIDHIAHVEQQGVRLYTGNYSDFEISRAQQLANQQSAYDKQQREITHIRQFVDRFRAKATKARQAQARLKALARMEMIAPAHVDSPFHFAFQAPEKVPNPLLRLENVAIGYCDKVILEAVGLTLVPGDRVGLLGPNGAGKSTLIKLLAGEIASLSGKHRCADGLRIGYFAQHQLEQLHLDDSPLMHVQRLNPKASEKDLRQFLGGFGFQGDRAMEPVAPLSGGEKARLVLAMLVYQRPNLLLLDEPTNHLDLEMRHALTLALQEFEGAMVIVSHDRHLLRMVTDQLLLVADQRVELFDGDLDDYRQWLSERRLDERSDESNSAVEHSAAARKDKRRLEAQWRQRLQPLRKEIQHLETLLQKLNTEKAAIEQQLADPKVYEESGKTRLMALIQDQNRVNQSLHQTEEAWLTACENLETAEQEVQAFEG